MWALGAKETEDMVRRSVAGDGRASECLCASCLPFVRAILRQRWRRSWLSTMVEDAVQEVFLECLRTHGALARMNPARRTHLEAYLRGVANNVAARMERREARFTARREPDADVLLFAISGAETPQHAGQTFASDAVRAAMATLDSVSAGDGHTMSELVHMHFGDGMPIRVIAAKWGVPATRVHELRRRACDRLRRRLGTMPGS